MKVNTTRFGEIEVEDKDVITFVMPIWGFNKYTKYVFVKTSEENPLLFLQSLEDPSLAFVVIQPGYFYPDYKIKVSKDDLALLQVKSPEELTPFSIVVIPGDNPENMTANLKAPILINFEKMIAGQFLSLDENYQVRHKILEEMRKNAERIKGAQEGK